MLEHGAYRTLLDRYYSTEEGIPAAQAYRLARARSEEERQAVDAVLEEFFELVDGVWINGRAEEEIAKAAVRINAAKENGKKGGRPKKTEPITDPETQQKPSGFSLGSENETQQKAPQAPSTKHHTPVVNQAAACTQPPVAREEPPAAAAPADPIHVRACELTALVRSRGARLNAMSPDVRSWAEQGVTDAQLLTAFDIAEGRRTAKEDPTPVNSGLLTAILRDVTAKPQQARASPGRMTRDESRAIAASTRLSDFRAACAADANRGQNDERTIEAPTAPRQLG